MPGAPRVHAGREIWQFGKRNSQPHLVHATRAAASSMVRQPSELSDNSVCGARDFSRAILPVAFEFLAGFHPSSRSRATPGSRSAITRTIRCRQAPHHARIAALRPRQQTGDQDVSRKAEHNGPRRDVDVEHHRHACGAQMDIKRLRHDPAAVFCAECVDERGGGMAAGRRGPARAPTGLVRGEACGAKVAQRSKMNGRTTSSRGSGCLRKKASTTNIHTPPETDWLSNA